MKLNVRCWSLGGAEDLDRGLHLDVQPRELVRSVGPPFCWMPTRFSAIAATRSTSSIDSHLQPDLRQLDLLALHRAGLLADDRVAEDVVRQRQREVDVQVQVALHHRGALAAGPQAGRLEHADDRQHDRPAAARRADADESGRAGPRTGRAAARPCSRSRRRPRCGRTARGRRSGRGRACRLITSKTSGVVPIALALARRSPRTTFWPVSRSGTIFSIVRQRLQPRQVRALQAVIEHPLRLAAGLVALRRRDRADQDVARAELLELLHARSAWPPPRSRP